VFIVSPLCRASGAFVEFAFKPATPAITRWEFHKVRLRRIHEEDTKATKKLLEVIQANQNRFEVILMREKKTTRIPTKSG
jgi:hypothetical protein